MPTIYLDHNATTPIHPEVVDAMTRCYAEVYANPASAHRPGQQARCMVENAREKIAAILDVDLSPPRRDRVIFTSGGTEANNLALLGIARASVSASPSENQSDVDANRPGINLNEPGVGANRLGVNAKGLGVNVKGPGVGAKKSSPRPLAGEGLVVRAGDIATDSLPPQIIISSAEHQSVIEPAEHLLEQGWRLDTIGLTSQGVVRLDQFEQLLSDQTKLVSIQLGNHETGVLQPLAEVAALCRKAGVPLHTDAVQVVGKIPVSFRALDVSAMSIAAHKFRGPLGIGALILRDGVPLVPLMFGGHQQEGLRPGTESAALAVGMATALELWHREQEEYARRLAALRDRFEAHLRSELPNIVVHGAEAARLPQTSNIAFPGLDGQILLMALDLAGVACSVGSACSSGSTELSPTLRAMNLSNDLVASSLRFSLGATTTEPDVDEAVQRIHHVCREIGG